MPRGSKPGERRGGRKKGTPNKLTGELKDMILGALSDAGGRAYLKKQASDNPAAFMTLVGKVLPLQVGQDPNSAALIPAGAMLNLVASIIPGSENRT